MKVGTINAYQEDVCWPMYLAHMQISGALIRVEGRMTMHGCKLSVDSNVPNDLMGIAVGDTGHLSISDSSVRGTWLLSSGELQLASVRLSGFPEVAVLMCAGEANMQQCGLTSNEPESKGVVVGLMVQNHNR